MIREQSFDKKGSNTTAEIATQHHRQGIVGKQASKSTKKNENQI